MIKGVETYFEKYPNGKLVMERYEEGRNEAQQGLLHIIIREIAKQTGCGEEWFKQEFLKRNCENLYPHWPHDFEVNRNGKRVLVPKSESRLSKREESEQIEHLHALCSEWGITIEDHRRVA